MFLLKDLKGSTHISTLDNELAKELQTILTAIGYPVVIDGIVGAKTTQAFHKFKLDNKLTQLDYIGVTTLDVMFKLLPEDLAESENVDKQQPPELSKPLTVGTINWSNFNSPVSKWFTVGEVFRHDNKRYTTDLAIRNRVVTLANELDKIREAWGSAIAVTSWYRPPNINRQVGGASNSRHLSGDGVDIYPMDGRMTEFQKWLDKDWNGALGYGAKKGFVHLDMRNGNGWKRGASKGVRWNY